VKKQNANIFSRIY